MAIINCESINNSQLSITESVRSKTGSEVLSSSITTDSSLIVQSILSSELRLRAELQNK